MIMIFKRNINILFQHWNARDRIRQLTRRKPMLRLDANRWQYAQRDDGISSQYINHLIMRQLT